MIKLTSRHLIGVAAMLCSSVAMSATIVNVTPSVASSAGSPIPSGTPFFIVVSAVDMLEQGGASLAVGYDSSLVTLGSVQLCTVALCGSDAPFDFLSPVTTDSLNQSHFTFAINAGTVPAGSSFDAIRINFTANNAGAAADAAIQIIDDGGAFCWGDPNNFVCYTGFTYNQPSVFVGASAGPAITVTDSVNPTTDHIVAFGSISQGQTDTQTVTIANSGTSDLHVGTLTSPAAPFSLTNDTCSGQTISAAAQCTVQVVFAPIAVGAVPDDSFDIPSDASGGSVTVTLSGTGAPPPTPNITVTDSVGSATDHAVPFGSITQGQTDTRVVTITNSGSADLHVGTLAAVDTLAAPFSLGTDNCSGHTLTQGSLCTVQVVFAPTVVGAVPDDTFDIPSDDPDPSDNPVIVTLSGTGAPPPAPNIDVTDSVLPTTDHDIPFGTVTVGGLSVQTVTVTNTGNAPLTLGAIGGTNALAPPFSIANNNCPTGPLAAAASCTFEVEFQPTVVGTPPPDAFDIPSDDADTPSVIVNVSGDSASAGIPDITVTDSVAPAADLQVPFADVNVYAFGHQTVTVTNDGAGDLIIGTVGSGNPLAGAFTIVADGCSGQTLASSESCTIGVDFRPTAVQSFNDAFDIPSNDPDASENPVTVTVSGNGKPKPENGNSALDPATLLGLGLVGIALRRRRRS